MIIIFLFRSLITYFRKEVGLKGQNGYLQKARLGYVQDSKYISLYLYLFTSSSLCMLYTFYWSIHLLYNS